MKKFCIMLIGVLLLISAINYATEKAPAQRGKKCGNGICEPNESCFCPEDCCGNKICQACENPGNCRVDCCGYCGDGLCLGFACGEDDPDSPYYCPKQKGGDCGHICGNGTCEKGESPEKCPDDCKWQKCGDGVCTGSEGVDVCPQDCHGKTN